MIPARERVGCPRPYAARNPKPQIQKKTEIVIQDAFKKALDDMQLAPALDEENFQEARSMARHVLAPFEVPSEVRFRV
jgi:hypothetical protein